MKNLTNEQLNVLAEAFMERVAEAKEEFMATDEYKSEVEKVKEEVEYDRIKELIEENNIMTESIEALNKKIADNKEVIKRALYPKTHRLYSTPEPERVDEKVEEMAFDRFRDKFPRESQVKAAIVMMGIKKSDNILDDLATKFNIGQ